MAVIDPPPIAPVPTVERIRQLLREAVPGAEYLRRKLERPAQTLAVCR